MALNSAATAATHPPLAAAIVLAAGKGTRVKADVPKMLLPMCGRTLVGHVNAAIAAIKPVHTVFVVRHEREKVAGHIRQINPEAIIADQDAVKGTGRAAWCALQALPPDLTGPVLVTAGDTPLITSATFAALAASLQHHAATLLSALVANPAGYGRVLRAAPAPAAAAAGPNEFGLAAEVGAAGPNEFATDVTAGALPLPGAVTGVVEDRDATAEQLRINEINTSVYVFDAAFLRQALENIGTDNAQGEMYLTDVIAQAAADPRGVGSYTLDLSASIEAEGVNDLAQLAHLTAIKRREINDRLLRSGVYMEDPEHTYVDVTAHVAPNAVLEPGVILRGVTQVEAYARIGAYSVLTDSHVSAGEQLPPHTVR